MARLRPVVISQPIGLAGWPSCGQCSAAAANASCAASSASSMSPSDPTSVARTRPHSSRKTSSSPLLSILEDRASLDRAAVTQVLQLGGDCEGLVQVRCLNNDEAAEIFLAVDEWSVGQQCLAASARERGG